MVTQETEIRESNAVDFSAAAIKAKSNGHTGSSTNVSSDYNVTEIFPWRPEGEGKAPIRIEIRPHVLKRSDLTAIDQAAEDAEAARTLLSEKRTKLIEKRVSLEADRYIESEIDEVSEEDSDIIPKLAKVNMLITCIEKELNETPSGWQVRAERFIIPVVKSWPLTYKDDPDDKEEEEKIIPLIAKEIVAKFEPVRLQLFHRDLQSFLFRDRKKKGKG